jgi:hypothetical protein
MQHLEVSGAVILYIGRTVSKGITHMPCHAPALLRQCRVLRESPHGSRKYPNCQSRSVIERLFFSVLLPLFSSSMTNVTWVHTGRLHLRVVCY